MKSADHHLRRIDQAVVESRKLTRPEPACPMRFFQLASQTRLAVGDPSQCEKAILEVTRQKGTVSPIFDRLSLGVQHPLYSVDDVTAMGQEELEKFDVRLKRHLARTRSGWPVFRRKAWMKNGAVKESANHKSSLLTAARGSRRDGL